MTSEEVVDSVRSSLEEHFDSLEDEEFVPGESEIKLSRPTFGADEVLEAMDSLLSTYVTMGDKVSEFERAWSDYVGSDHAHMVNSGSSANLLALKALEGEAIQPGEEVIVPAVAWSTSVFPILDANAKPVLVDVNPKTYTIDVDAFSDAITDQTAAVVLVHLLGNPCEMEPILEICERENIAIVEDCCEAHGAAYDGQPVGTFGDIGTFSYFFSHHISTIEGGVVVTDDPQLSKRVRTGRAHGWIREVDDPEAVKSNSDIDPRFLFIDHGYNVRPTEIQGAFGIHQIPKLGQFVERRRENAAALNTALAQYSEYLQLFEESDRAYCSWFAYPMLVREDAPFTRDQLQSHLEEHNIETRPILAGNLARQPVIEKIDCRISGDLSGAEYIHDNGLFIGNNHRLTEEKREYIVSTISSFIGSERK